MQVLSIKDAAKRIGVSRTTLYELAKNPSFPQPVAVTEARRVFVEEEFDDWLAKRAAMRSCRKSNAEALTTSKLGGAS